jgi:tyrosine-protein phosphatase SIW14
MAVDEAPMVRPQTWAQPVVAAPLENFYRVNADIYRSAQPEVKDLSAIKALGIRSVISLREHHDDPKEFASAGLELYHYPMNAGKVSTDDLIAVLKLIWTAPKPVLVHCQYGSDRTGFIMAGYRCAVMGWDVQESIRELRLGGYGYHEASFPNVKKTLAQIDFGQVRKSVGLCMPH